MTFKLRIGQHVLKFETRKQAEEKLESVRNQRVGTIAIISGEGGADIWRLAHIASDDGTFRPEWQRAN